MNQRNKGFLFLFSLLLLLPVAVWAAQNMGGNPYGLNPYGYTQPVVGQPVWYYKLYLTLYESRWAQHFLSALFGAFIGAFFSQKLRKLRKWFFIAIVVLGAITGIVLNAWLGNITFFILGAVTAYYLLRETIKAVGNAIKKKKEKLSTFGTAEWANLEHLQENELIGQEGFSLGAYLENGKKYPLHYIKDRHLLTVAPTRSGKGASSIVPNLLTYEGSVIVIDPKGENALITAARRGNGGKGFIINGMKIEDLNIPGMGQKVHIVDPWGITGLPASCFNPFDWLQSDDPDINENAMMLADSIITTHEGSREPFWDEEAKALLMGLLLHVALAETEQQNRTLGRVRDIICMGKFKQNAIFDEMQESLNPIVSSTAYRTTSKEEKLKSSVLASLQSHTHFLDSPRIRASLEKSDFRFEDLKTSKMTIYLVLPADRLQTFGRWLRLLIQQALTVNARNVETKPEKPVLFLLDEMAALGRLTMVEQAFSLMAGFGMQLWGIIQDLSQLDRIYDKGWETFIGNSGVLQYFGSRDHKTAEYFSKLCGVTTIVKFSFARTLAKAIGSSWSSSSTTSSGQGSGSSTSGAGGSVTDTISTADTIDVVQRHLAYPDELMVLRENKELVLIENFNPIPARKEPWFDDPVLKTMGIDLHKKPIMSAYTTGKPLASTRPIVSVSKPLVQPDDTVKAFMNSVVLKEKTYEKAMSVSFGLDVCKLEEQWRIYIIKKNKKINNPDSDFIGFCRWTASNYEKIKLKDETIKPT